MLEEAQQVEPVQDVKETGVNLLDLVLMFTARWRLFAVLMVSFALLGGMTSLFLKKKYVARVTFATQSDDTRLSIVFLEPRRSRLPISGLF